MPKIGFSSENKVQQTNYDFPKLKLAQNERARIVVLQDPDMEYTHQFQKPVIENGRAKMETAKKRNGDEYPTNVMKFVRNPLCRGDFATLQSQGSDPKNCPACKMAKEHPDWMKAPKRRYAMHVVRYRTQSGKFTTADPFAVETLVWSFTDRIFNKLIEFGEEVGDLKDVDLLLGPCENAGFQKFDITTGNKAEWQANDARKKLTVETLKGGMIPDLKIAIGNDQTEFYMNQDLEEIAEAWEQVSAGTKSEPTQSLSDGLDGLFDGQSGKKTEIKREEAQDDWVPESTETPADEAPKSSSSTDDLLGGLLGSSPDEDEEPAASKPSGGTSSFDDLLDSIKS